MFSHGLIGLGVMIAVMLTGLLTSPIMTDSPIYIYIMLGIIAISIFAGIILMVLYNLSDILKEKTNFIFIPLALFGIAIILSLILSKIVEYRYGIRTTVL